MKKIAVVTGASSGMGLECVRQIIRKYSDIEEIWLLARRTERLERLAAEYAGRCRLVCMTADLTNSSDREMLKYRLAEEKPFIKVLVNAAGYGLIGPFMALSEEKITDMTELNCVALADITRMCLKYMHAGSRVIQFASSAAFLPQPYFSVYAATKAYVLSLSRALNYELRKRRITVTAVCPGPVKTEFFDIAETTGKVKLYKKLVMADPVKVVAKAFEDAENGKDVSVYGAAMKAFRIIARIIPNRLLFYFFG